MYDVTHSIQNAAVTCSKLHTIKRGHFDIEPVFHIVPALIHNISVNVLRSMLLEVGYTIVCIGKFGSCHSP